MPVWNRAIRKLARAYPVRPGRNAMLALVKACLLAPAVEELTDVFGDLRMRLDLGAGYTQKDMFLFPERYESRTQAFLKLVLRPGMTVFDVGAHVGFYTILMASLVGRTGRVYSFEPHAPNAHRLRENLEINGIDWVDLQEVAVCDRNTDVELHVNPLNDGGHSLADLSGLTELRAWRGRNLNSVNVRALALDAFVRDRNIQNISLIKIDAEGAEQRIISGADNILRSGRVPLIICETGNESQTLFGSTESRLRDMLYAFGYKSYLMDMDFTELAPSDTVPYMQNVVYALEGACGLWPLTDRARMGRGFRA